MAANSKKQRRGKPFAPGQSGNPSGRPKLPPEVVEVRDLARAYTKDAMGTVVEIARNKKAPPAARVAASNVILDRGWGRPSQPLEGKDGADLFPRKLIVELMLGR